MMHRMSPEDLGPVCGSEDYDNMSVSWVSVDCPTCLDFVPADPHKPSGRQTPIRHVRLSDELWSAISERAENDRVTRSEVIREALAAYL